MPYVDGFVIPVKKDKIDVYKAHAKEAGVVWMELGALSFVECVGDDVPYGQLTSFPRAVQAGDDEVVIFSWIVYNLDRPHEALNYNVPASRYRPSSRAMPDNLPRVDYDEHEIVRTVSTTKAYVSFKGRLWKVPQAFRGERLAIRPIDADGRFGIFFAAHQVAAIELG